MGGRCRGFELSITFGDRGGQVKVLNTSKYKGDLALGDVTKVREPRGKQVIVSKIALFSTKGGVFLGPRGEGINCLFRGCTLFPGVAIRRGVKVKFAKGGRSGRGVMRRLVRRFRLSKLRGLCPSGLSNKRRREATLTQVVTCRPSIVLLSRPFSTLSTCLQRQVLARLVRVLDSCRNAIVVISRDESRVCDFDRRILMVRSKRKVHLNPMGRMFGTPHCGAITELAKYGGVTSICQVSTRAICIGS